MHIIAILGSIVSILWILHRLAEMGIDLGGLNPWLWRRRRNWRKQYEGDPIFNLSQPLEAAGVLLVAVAKADGDMSSEEKNALLEIFSSSFHLSSKDAAGLLSGSAFLYGNGEAVRDKLDEVLKPVQAVFSPDQAESVVELMKQVAGLGEQASATQLALIRRTEQLLRPAKVSTDAWN